MARRGWSEAGIRVAALAVLIVLLTGGVVSGRCLFLLHLGVPCPACGLTRSVAETLSLRLALAVLHHPLGPAVTLLAVALLLGGRATLAALVPMPRDPQHGVWDTRCTGRRLLWAAALLVAAWVVRLLRVPVAYW